MGAEFDLPADELQRIRNIPLHPVLVDLGRAAIQYNVHCTVEFKKLIAYLMEQADGRDRRDPWVHRPGIARPVPKLRVAIDACFGTYGDLHWFKLTRTTNQSGMPLLGQFPRMAASLARVKPADFGAIVAALLASNPETAILRMVSANGGQLRGVTVQLFSRLALAYRRDLFFVIPKPWGQRSGCLKFIDRDLRKYCALSRSLREVCDRLRIKPDIRGSVFHRLITAQRLHPDLEKALAQVIGPTMARYAVLEPSDGYEADAFEPEQAVNPLELAAKSIRARRGDRRLRTLLGRAYGNRCAITGPCPQDLLELAYIVPFPSGNVHSIENAVILRTDLHTLWDLNLIAVHPESLKVHISGRLRGTPYENLANRPLLKRRDGSRASQRALRERWAAFIGAGQSTLETDFEHEPDPAPAPAEDRPDQTAATPEADPRSPSTLAAVGAG